MAELREQFALGRQLCSGHFPVCHGHNAAAVTAFPFLLSTESNGYTGPSWTRLGTDPGQALTKPTLLILPNSQGSRSQRPLLTKAAFCILITETAPAETC